jgi:hypothetical protein
MRSLPLDLARYWGVVRWAKPLLDIVFDGVSSTVDFQLRQLLPTGYYRFQTTLHGQNHSLDNASPDNITALKGLANDLIDESSEELEELCDELKKSE